MRPESSADLWHPSSWARGAERAERSEAGPRNYEGSPRIYSSWFLMGFPRISSSFTRISTPFTRISTRISMRISI